MGLLDDFLDVYVPETGRVERIHPRPAEVYDLLVVDDDGHVMPWSHLYGTALDEADDEPLSDEDDDLEDDDEDDLDDEDPQNP